MSEGFNIKSLIVPALALGAVGLLIMGSSSEAHAGEKKPDGGGGGTPPPGKEPAQCGVDSVSGKYECPTQDGSPWATPGKQSSANFTWLFTIPEGHTGPAQLAKFITGDERRYKELFAANLTKSVVVTDKTNFFGTNFAQWRAGEKIRMPSSWNQYIDETGAVSKPAGTVWPK